MALRRTLLLAALIRRQHHRDVPATATASGPMTATLDDTVIDDWAFGVSAIGAGGGESPIVFPGDAGSV